MARFQKGTSGNPRGRPRGSRNRATALRQRLVKDADAILDAVVKAAKGGDVQAAKLILDRCLPALKPVDAAASVRTTSKSLSGQADKIVKDALSGQISPSQARELTAALANAARVREIADLAVRLEALEDRLAPKDNWNQ